MAQTTALNALHRAAGAKLVDFAGWEMPLHYGSQIEEHHAVRRAAGMFDVSHMRAVEVLGAGARDFLRYALANDVARLDAPGRALYSCLLDRKRRGRGRPDRVPHRRGCVSAGGQRRDRGQGHRLARRARSAPPARRRDRAAPGSGADRGPGAGRARARLGGDPRPRGGDRRPAPLPGRVLPRLVRRAHRLHRRGRLRAHAARAARRAHVAAVRRRRRQAVRTRRPRHAAAGGGHGALRPGDGRGHEPARGRPRLDRRHENRPRLRRPRGARPADALAPRARSTRPRGAARASDRAHRARRGGHHERLVRADAQPLDRARPRSGRGGGGRRGRGRGARQSVARARRAAAVRARRQEPDRSIPAAEPTGGNR